MTGTSVFSLLGKLAIDGVDETKKALEDVSKSGEDTKNKLSVSFQDIGNKAGDMGKKMALGLAGVVTAAFAGVEATREFRQDYGKLEATFETTNQATGTAKETFTTLFGILGEDDTAIETANHLAMMTNNEKDLSQWTDILTGVYATFGDSLPLEGLAEAANETARVGQVTGPLADALNWAGVSEDAFNEKLEKCTSTQERERLIRETLNGLYGEASATYKDVNGNVIANNEAQAELNMKLAETTSKLEPMITKAKLFLADVLVKAQPLITWVIDNINILAPIILGFMGALFALNIASKIMALIPVITALNAVMMANPVSLIVVGVAALIAILVTLWTKCDAFREFVTKWFTRIVDFVKNNWQGLLLFLVNPIAGAFKLIYDNCEGFRNFVDKWIKKIVDFFKNNWKNLLLLIANPFAGAFKLLYDNCEGFRNFVNKWIGKIKDFFVNGFNTIKNKVVSTVTNLVDGAKNKFNSFKSSVSSIFNSVKSAITRPIEIARDTVKKVVDKIKSFFKFSVSLPKIKLPHFKISPSGWQIGDLLKGKIPKLGIDWYAKAVRSPMLLESPTAFGISSSGNIQVGGEAGSEIVGGTNTIMRMISSAVSSNNGGIENKLDRLIVLLTNYLPALSNQQVVLSTGELVGALTTPIDKSLGSLADDRRRGR